MISRRDLLLGGALLGGAALLGVGGEKPSQACATDSSLVDKVAELPANHYVIFNNTTYRIHTLPPQGWIPFYPTRDIAQSIISAVPPPESHTYRPVNTNAFLVPLWMNRLEEKFYRDPFSAVDEYLKMGRFLRAWRKEKPDEMTIVEAPSRSRLSGQDMSNPVLSYTRAASFAQSPEHVQAILVEGEIVGKEFRRKPLSEAGSFTTKIYEQDTLHGTRLDTNLGDFVLDYNGKEIYIKGRGFKEPLSSSKHIGAIGKLLVDFAKQHKGDVIKKEFFGAPFEDMLAIAGFYIQNGYNRSR